MTTTTADPTTAAPARDEPLDAERSNAILFAAAVACEDETIEALAAARELGNPDAIARCTAERDLFDRLAVALRANRRARVAAA